MLGIQDSERSCICVLDVMYLCVRDIDFASFYDFSIGSDSVVLWNCSDSVVFFTFIFVIILSIF